MTIRFNMNADEAETARIELAAQELHGQVAEISVAQEALVQAFGNLLNSKRVGEALQRAKIGIETLAIQDQQLSQELDALQKQVKDKESYAGRLLEASQTDLAYLREVRQGTAEAPSGLVAKVNELEALMARKDTPTVWKSSFVSNSLSNRFATKSK